MKPIITWVVLANAQSARALAHRGPGSGLSAVAGKTWHAPEVPLHRDAPGVGHSIAGPGVSAVEETSGRELVDDQFAKVVAAGLARDCKDGHFARLIVIAGPHTLGLLRKHLDASLRRVIIGEIPKDLSLQPLEQIERQLGEFIAV